MMRFQAAFFRVPEMCSLPNDVFLLFYAIGDKLHHYNRLRECLVFALEWRRVCRCLNYIVLHVQFSPVVGSLPRRHHRRFLRHAWRSINSYLAASLCQFGRYGPHGSEETEKTPLVLIQAAGLNEDSVQHEGTRQPELILDVWDASSPEHISKRCRT